MSESTPTVSQPNESISTPTPVPQEVAPQASVPATAHTGSDTSFQYVAPPPAGAVGKLRDTGVCVLLLFVTLGIYSLVWYFKTQDEMKRHSGQGIGGGLALLLALLVGFVMPFISSSEVGSLYERRGLAKPVSGATGLWILLPLVGWIVWFVKTNGALNGYWRSLGVA